MSDDPSPKKLKLDEKSDADEAVELPLKKEETLPLAAAKWTLMSQIDKLSEDNGWKSILTAQAKKSKSLFDFVEGLPQTKVLPKREDIFAAFEYAPLDKVKVVILGQDPYHGPGQAHGLSFSVKPGISVPPSLKNIFKEAKQDLTSFSYKDGNLVPWANQGVLLLNTLLTVEPSTPNAHKGKGWESFTDACIVKLSETKSNLVFFLWGKPAQEKAKLIKNAKNHLIINSSHPSPLGANAKNQPFFGSKCFSKCNEYLKANGLEEIDWNLS